MFLRDKIRPTLALAWIAIFYEDILGTRYRVTFENNAIGTFFTARIEELDPKDLVHKRFFA